MSGTITQNPPTSFSIPTLDLVNGPEYSVFLTFNNFIGRVNCLQVTGADIFEQSTKNNNKFLYIGNYAVGNYTMTGTTSDSSTNTGTFTYTLNITPVTILQTNPLSESVITNNSATFTSKLNFDSTTYYAGSSVTCLQTSSSTSLIVDSSGNVSTTGTLSIGTYTASGTTSDSLGDTGTFTYTLIVTDTIDQITPFTGSILDSTSASFNDELKFDPNTYIGSVICLQTFGSTSLIVDSSGNVSTTGTLSSGTYTASGTTSDSLEDTGTFTYTLKVTETIEQIAPLTNNTLTSTSLTFKDELKFDSNTYIGSVTCVKTSGSTSLIVDSSGNVTTTGYLSIGTYTASGTTSDSFGDTGTFTYTLYVSADTIIQTDPTIGFSTEDNSLTFTAELKFVSTTYIGSVTCVTSSGSSPSLIVDSSGNVTTTGSLSFGTYTAFGTTSDSYGNTGNFTYTLFITNIIIQEEPLTGSVIKSGSESFTSKLKFDLTTYYTGSSVTCLQTSPLTYLRVDSSGNVTTTASLSIGSYNASGTTSDGYGDTGTFTYTLTVFDTIIQEEPFSEDVISIESSSFNDELKFDPNTYIGFVTCLQTFGSTSLIVDSSGNVTTTGSLSAGTYTASGTTSDSLEDTGTFTYTLTVSTNTIVQISPFTGNVLTNKSSSFNDQLNFDSNTYIGFVTCVSSSDSSPSLIVSSSGYITTTGYLSFGTYTASGTTSDSYGNFGTFTYTLTVQQRPPCFLSGSKILTDTGYKVVEDLRKGDLVKTLKNDYLPIVLIGKSLIYNSGDNDRIKNRLYNLSINKYDELTEDLVLTGCHSILTDILTKEQEDATLANYGAYPITDGKVRLETYLDDKADPYLENGTFTVYHLALENENYFTNYGIWANGLLVESCSKRYLTELSGMELIE